MCRSSSAADLKKQFHYWETDMTKSIFVFGSNEAGIHGAGSALFARRHHGAQPGVGVGRTGDAYAIPTKDKNLNVLPLPRICTHVCNFIDYAKLHRSYIFDVVKIGCGLAGYREEQIAWMFINAPANVNLPAGWRELGLTHRHG